MHFENVKRWQWVVIALVLGVTMGVVRTQLVAFDDAKFQTSINTQQEFENSVLNPVNLGGEQRVRFKNLAVVRIKPPPNKPKVHYVVTGKYLPRMPKRTDDGKLKWEYMDCFFPVEVPYVATTKLNPQPDPAQAKFKPSPLQRLAELVRIKEPDPPDSVLNFLQAIKTSKSIDFKYEWWKAPRVTLVAWIVGSLVVVGGIWPTIINLVAFGSLVRPPEEKGIDLSKVKDTSGPTGYKSQAVSQEEMNRVSAMGDALEDKLRESARARGPAAAATPAAAAPIKQLTATQLEVANIDQHIEDKHFEAKADDFYPVERHHKPEGEHK